MPRAAKEAPGAGAAAEIDAALAKLVKGVTDGTLKKDDAEVQLQVLNTAIKWYVARNRVGAPRWGSALGAGDDDGDDEGDE